MTYTVVTLGDLVADQIVSIGHLPVEPFRHQVAEEIVLEAGGTGNFLITATRLGLRAAPLGVVGQDVYGERVLAMLRREGVDMSSVIVPEDSRTTMSIVLVDRDARHVFVWMRGTGERQPFREQYRAALESAHALFTTGYALHPAATFTPAAVRGCLKAARQRGTPIFFDLGPGAAELPRETIAEAVGMSTVLLATTEEIALWTGRDDPLGAAREVLRQGPPLVVVKRGGDGCLLVTAEQQVVVEAFPVVVRNTAGAGDAFGAAVVYGYLAGYSLGQIGALANAVGALAVATLGTGTRLASRQEIARLLREHGHTFLQA